MEWVLCSEALPEIPDGGICSVQVLGGCWVTDEWLREDHPKRRRFLFGPCSVITDSDLSEFPNGKRWMTFGPSHSEITHWAYVTPPTDAPQ